MASLPTGLKLLLLIMLNVPIVSRTFAEAAGAVLLSQLPPRLVPVEAPADD
jgi:hypothetical protein